jgi:ferrochelatase
MTKTAVVLFNLGGPDGPGSVEPFLFNLFNDKAIIGAPLPVRWLLAKLISKRRGKVAREIYENLGGGSPLLANTMAQAVALEDRLGDGFNIFVCMRYWHPMAEEVARAVKHWGPDEILLLPLYPQFSTTTTGSSAGDWARAAARIGLSKPTRTVCCYPRMDGFVGTMAEGIGKAVEAAGGPGACRVLYSAHGLPEKIVKGGDPYQWQVEQTAAAIDARLSSGQDSLVCYQSRVGPLTWIGPSTDDEIERAGRDGKAVVLAPIAFVSEHSETLVELDIEYRHLAETAGVPSYHRVATAATDPRFINGLAELVWGAADSQGVCPVEGARFCSEDWTKCPCRDAAGGAGERA